MNTINILLALGLIVQLLLIVILIIIILKRRNDKTQETIAPVMQNFQGQLEGIRERFEVGLDANAKATNDRIAELRNNVSERMKEVIEQMNARLKENSEAMQNINKTVGDRMDATSKVIADVRSNLGGLDESVKTMTEIGKDMSQLQDLLSTPKFRGEIGETMLENILKDIFPASLYKLQYRFSTGAIVDAVINLSNKLVPIDSKFPLGEFKKLQDEKDPNIHKKLRRDFDRIIKKNIQSISEKYIRPDEGTFDFALMFIGSENVYYEIIIKGDSRDDIESINEYALKKRVIPVSSNSLYAYIITIVYGMKGMEIEKQAQYIMNSLEQLKIDFDKFNRSFAILGNHISNARGKYEEAASNLNRFETKLISVNQPNMDKPPELE